LIRLAFGYLLFIIPGIVMSIRYTLYAPVVLIEGLEKKAALKRARELGSRSWRTVIIVSILQILIPLSVSSLVGRIRFGGPSADAQATSQTRQQTEASSVSGSQTTNGAAVSTGTPPPTGGLKIKRSDEGRDGNVRRQIWEQFLGLMNILIVPLISIVPALLYLKMRQLGGETLNEAIQQMEDAETSRSQWQQRMRTRLSLNTPATTSGKTTTSKADTPRPA